MSRRSERRKKRIRNEAQRRSGMVKIDERIQYGPLELIRAGKHVIMRNNSNPEEQAEILKHMAKANKELLTELEVKILALQGLIAQYDPLDLMHMAGYKALEVLIEGKTESELSHEQNKVLPGLEYLQYLISRTPGNPKANEPNKEQWDEIWGKVLDVLDTTSQYLSTRAPKGKNPAEIESLVHSLDLKRLIVRVDRFPNFMEEYWRTSLEPYDNLLQEIYGASAANIVEGLKELAENQKHGVFSKYKASFEAVDRVRAKARELGVNDEDPEAYKDAVKQYPELKALHDDTQEKAATALTVKLFEITDVSSLPKPILSLLSVKPGEQPLNKLTGPNHEDLSPLSTDTLHYKPFLEVDGKYYAFYHSGFEDRMAEIIAADLNQKQPAKRTAIEKARSDYIEKLVIDLLSRIVKPSFVGTNLYYPNPDKEGGLTELDGLIEVDDTLLIVEVKSGGISEGASRGAPDSLASDLKDLIFEGQRQSERAERYIKSEKEVKFFDDTGKKTKHTLSQAKFRKIYRVVVTREQLGWVGADLAKMSVLEPTLTDNMPWQISLDDLHAIADLFADKGIEFVHYLGARLEAARSDVLSQRDEVDHVALYNSMNYYHKNVTPDATRLTFQAYGLEIDKYFMAKTGGEELPRPEQKMSKELHEIIEALNQSNEDHRFEVGTFLLDNDSAQRKDVTKRLKLLSSKQSSRGRRTIRLISKDLRLGISIGQVTAASWEQEELRCALYMSKHGLERWLSVHVDFDGSFKVSKIVELTAENYTSEQLDLAQAKLSRDLKLNIAKLNIARNQECPCGSGERFKNCHGKRNA